MSMRVTFLGTSGAVPTTERNPSSVLVNREGDRLLFDAGEGTQRQMMRYGTGFTISDIFVTHLHGDHVLGIPGLIQTWDFNGRDDPLTIYTPQGTGEDVRSLVTAAGNEPSYPVTIVEVGAGEVALERDEYVVRTFRVEHRTTAVGYALVEDDRKGRFNRERAEELGVPVGPKFQELHAGNPVELADGTVVQPDQVVGEPRPGRRFVYTGDTRPTETVVDAAENADLLIHDATFADDRADRAAKTGHSTAREAAEVAREAGAARLALTHLSSRYAGDTSAHEREARAAFEESERVEGSSRSDEDDGSFDGEVFVARDGQKLDIPYPA